MAKKRKKKYKPLTRKAKFRLALVIAAGLLILALLVGLLVMLVKGGLYLISQIKGTEPDDSLPAVSQQIDLEPYATVILDPGHGGSDGGAVAVIGEREIIEKDIDVDVTMKVKELLEESNVEVLLTREEDVDMDLKERTAFANETDADLFVSLHCNTSDEDLSANGLECYYEVEGEKGKDLAQNIMSAAEATGQIETRGLRTDMMYVVRFTHMPATLVEMGFMSNADELELLVSDSYQQSLAQAITDGILETLGLDVDTGEN